MNLVTTLFEFSWYFLFILTIQHSFKIHGKYPTLNFFIPLFILVLIVEGFAVNIFHGFYYPNYNLYIINVPLGILLGWCIITYVSFYLGKKILISELIESRIDLLKLSTTAALIGLSIDLILEPISSIWNLWIWIHPDIYFNASIENFISWFLIIFLFTSFYEYLSKKVKDERKIFFLILFSLIPQVTILITVIVIWKLTINL